MSANSARIYAALAGNPNAGKTSLFNRLTGANQRVGNYAGVTVEKKEGFRKIGDRQACFVDLPGLYGLSPYSEEEKIAQQFLVEDQPDVVVAVVDTTNLERHLYLTVQLVEMGRPMVVAMNMSDEAQAAGYRWKEEVLRHELGVEVVRTVGNRGRGIEPLSEAVVSVADAARKQRAAIRYSPLLEEALRLIEAQLPEVRWGVSRRWMAVKLLENDTAFLARLTREGVAIEAAQALAATWRERIAEKTGLAAETQLVEERYSFVRALYKKVMEAEPPAAVTTTEKIDRVLTNRWLGLPMFLVIMWALFQFVFTVGALPQEWMEAAIGSLGEFVGDNLPSGELRSLIVDGMIGGVGGVLVFLPNIVLLFFVISFLEDTGYLARAAFLMDRIMRGAGLHGKSFIPLLLGFGCNVTSVMATRTLENRSDRMITMLVAPLMSCSARLPVYVLLAGAFFPPEQAGTVMFGVYLFGVVMAVAMAYLFRRTLFKGEGETFVMEMPSYRWPTLRNVLQQMWSRSVLYLSKAGTIILSASILMWFLANYPQQPALEAQFAAAADKSAAAFSQQIENDIFLPLNIKTLEEKPAFLAAVEAMQAEEKEAQAAAETPEALVQLLPQERALAEQYHSLWTEWQVENKQLEQEKKNALLVNSYAGALGRFVEPAISPLGFDWKIGVSLIAAFAAKEIMVGTLGTIYSLEASDEEMDDLITVLAADPAFTPAVALSLMVFALLYVPCLATVAVIKREANSWGWAAFSMGYSLVLAWVASFVTYRVAQYLIG